MRDCRKTHMSRLVLRNFCFLIHGKFSQMAAMKPIFTEWNIRNINWSNNLTISLTISLTKAGKISFFILTLMKSPGLTSLQRIKAKSLAFVCDKTEYIWKRLPQCCIFLHKQYRYLRYLRSFKDDSIVVIYVKLWWPWDWHSSTIMTLHQVVGPAVPPPRNHSSPSHPFWYSKANL